MSRAPITDEELEQWATIRADDAGHLARELITHRRSPALREELDNGGWCAGSKCTCWQSETHLGYAKAGGTRADLVAAWLKGTDDLPDTAPVTLCIAGRHRYYDDLKILRLLSSPPALPHVIGSKAADDVLAERQRQIDIENWAPEHDDRYQDNELARAAACYSIGVTAYWPWDIEWWKPSQDRRRNLVKAAALLIAEIERVDRATAKGD